MQKSYETIKAVVFDHVHRTKGHVDYDALTAEVRKHFPESRWKKTHWSWYRTQITRGRFKDQFSDEERNALRNLSSKPRAVGPGGSTHPPCGAKRGPKARDDEVKNLGDPILNHVRFVIGVAARDNEALRFRLNRWVYSRLLQDEVRAKRPIKKLLWTSGMHACQVCGRAFSSLKGVEIHRKNPDLGYSVDNCELLCHKCHQSPTGEDYGRTESGKAKSRVS